MPTHSTSTHRQPLSSLLRSLYEPCYSHVLPRFVDAMVVTVPVDAAGMLGACQPPAAHQPLPSAGHACLARCRVAPVLRRSSCLVPLTTVAGSRHAEGIGRGSLVRVPTRFVPGECQSDTTDSPHVDLAAAPIMRSDMSWRACRDSRSRRRWARRRSTLASAGRPAPEHGMMAPTRRRHRS